MKERFHFQYLSFGTKQQQQELKQKPVFSPVFLYYKLTFYGFILQDLRDIYSFPPGFPYKLF